MEKPYQADISQLIKTGENELKIEIVNLWVNRFTGNMLLDNKDRFCKTNSRLSLRKFGPAETNHSGFKRPGCSGRLGWVIKLSGI